MAQWNAGSGAATLQINANVGTTSGNSSRVDWNLILYCYNGSSRHLDPTVPWSVNIAGNIYNGGFGFDFRYTTAVTIASGSTWVGHNAEGYAQIDSIGWMGDTDTSAIGGNVSVGGTWDLPRIAKPTTAPGAPIASNLTPTSVTFTWTAPTNTNGATVEIYKLRINSASPADGPGYVDYDVSATTFSHTVTNLTPGSQIFAVVYARNAVGFSPKSAETNVRTLSGAYVRRGGQWRPTELLARSGGTWKTGEPFVYTSGAWRAAA